ncbi:hypothetical protein WJX72_005886 [[Myrmecia] bisecta]|uniref:Uncharacterized protein n=1 Tax=[Myrmecia] bisecta TaxID=41462 RepID=A0AAW1Q289_9CHLO
MRVQTPASRPRICRNEVKSLLESSFQPASEELGSTSLLSPVRANSRLRGQLGSQKMVTPVRRSTRGLTPAKPTIASILEETDFAYAPNDLLRRSTRPRSATPTSPDASDEATAAADSDDSASETAGGGPERSTPMAGSQLVAATLQAAGDASVPPQEHEFNELTNMMAELAVQQAELSAPSTKAAKGRRLMGKPAGTPKGGSLTPELTPKGSDSRRKSRSRILWRIRSQDLGRRALGV